jgi:hypothetical protein
MVCQMVSGVIPGLNQSKTGITYRDVCAVDMTLVEPTKITPSQISNGNQYLRKDFIQKSARNAEHPTSNTERPMAERNLASQFLN